MRVHRFSFLTNLMGLILITTETMPLVGCGSEPGAAFTTPLMAGQTAPDAQLSVKASDSRSAADEKIAPESTMPAEAVRTAYTRLPVIGHEMAALPSRDHSALPARDARAAAAEPAPPGVEIIAPVGTTATWYTGTLAPGDQQHWYWDNAAEGVFKVGFSPVGASTTDACQFQVSQSWDSQASAGERQFHFILQNIGSISCAANILLELEAAAATWSTGGVNPGETQGWTWNNANPLDAAHFINISPTGATSTNSCDFEVTRSWYSQEPGGERRFHFYVQNIGSIACVGTVLLATNTNIQASWSTGTITPGSAPAWFWNNANPLSRIYVSGVSPLGAWGTNSCQLELLPTFYQEVFNSDGTTQRQYYVGVRNVGAISCAGTLLLNYLD